MLKKISKCTMILILLLMTTGCVKIIRQGEEGLYTGETTFNASDNIEEVWSEQAVPLLKEKAVSINDFLSESCGDFSSLADKYGDYSMGNSGELSYTLQGSGEVTSVVTDKKAGYMELKIDGYEGNVVLKIQIGSVFKGSSVRDSLDFIKFDDYKNQVDYASLSQTINHHIEKELLEPIDLSSLEGKKIDFIGCFTVNGNDEILLMPVIMSEKGV